jgi:hypothetical protein
MSTTITCAAKGCQFAVTIDGNADKATVEIFRDGTRLGEVPWGVEGFVPTGLLLLDDTDDSEDVYYVLMRAVREKVGPPSWMVADMRARGVLPDGRA